MHFGCKKQNKTGHTLDVSLKVHRNMKSEEEQRQHDRMDSFLGSPTGEFSLVLMAIPFPQELICSASSDLTPLLC